MDFILVVYCWDFNMGCVVKEFFFILEDLYFIDFRIYRYCFIGNVVEVMIWMYRLFNVKFGFIFNFLRFFGVVDVFCVIFMFNVFLELDVLYLLLIFCVNINILWVFLLVVRRIVELKGVVLFDVLV